MFKNLLDPNSEKALSKALETLDQNIADQRQALVHLIISNQEKLADSELINKIQEITTLFDLFQQAEEKLKQKVEYLLANILTAEALKPAEKNLKALQIRDKAIAQNHQDILYTLAKYLEQEDICQKVIDNLSLTHKESLLHDAKSDLSKTLIIHSIENIETLKRLEKELKGKDKKSYRLLQEKIERFEKAEEEKTLLIEKSKRILDSIEKLAKTTYAPLYDSKYFHIESEWKNLQEEIKASNFSTETIIQSEYFENFDKFSQQCKLLIDEVLQKEKAEQEKELNQIFLEKSLKHLKTFLSAESIEEAACAELIQSIKAKLSKSDASISFDSQVFSEYEAAFNAHLNFVKQAHELANIDEQLTALQTLFTSNHKKKKAEHETLSSIQNLVSEIKKIKDNYFKHLKTLDFEIQSLKLINSKISELQSLEKQSLDMQVEFQGKFDKKLGYVKTEIENKALNTVIRLCKEAQELLPFCPIKQQEKLQKRLDIYKEEIVKLEDWYNFATLPKRKELCEKMAELAKNAARSKIKVLKEDIKQLQDQWKELGHARDKESEALWEQFQEAGNLAYKPIKDLLDRKEQEKQKNLDTRQKILEKLSNHINHFYADNSKGNSETQKVDEQNSEKLLRHSQSNWNQAFPIPTGHHQLQKEFDEKIHLLNEKLKPVRSINLGRKNALLAQSEKLSELDNVNDAIEQAKKLQLEWKEVGFCENDDELWKQFRTSCDKIFEARDSLRDQQKGKEQLSITEAKSICLAIDSIDTDNVSDFESELRKLSSQFEEIKDLPKQRKDLQSNYLKVKKLAKAKLEDLKRNQESESFRNIIKVCEELGNIEKNIIDNKINKEDIDAEFETVCSNYKCPIDSKEPLKNSLFALYKGISNNTDYVQQQSNKFCTLCVELEIELDVDSPAQDKALRMELQVKRLNKKFNQSEKQLSISDKILSAFYLGGVNSFQDKRYVNRLIAMQNKAL